MTKGVMMGPHWNPNGDEVAVVLRGQGMVTVVCPSVEDQSACKNSKFRVAEGDLFVVPRYHPMAQISFNDESFVFVVFTIASKKNNPKFIAGKSSILQTLGKIVLAKSFKNVRNTTIDQILSAQRELAIFDCTSCAEEEEAGRQRGGGGRRQEAGREGEIARWEEEEMQRREREAEEAARRRGVAEGEGGHAIQ